MIPRGIEQFHVIQAISEIDDRGVPAFRKSHYYDLCHRGRKYPPKYVISIAVKHLNGQELLSSQFNAVEAKNFFARRNWPDFVVTDRRGRRVLPDPVDEDDESSFPEGQEKYRLHRYLERDSKLTRRVKVRRLKETGDLCCEACGFSFYATYGELGYTFIEAHHTTPISKLRGRRKTRISEISLVCSNCHRMLHHTPQRLSVAELRSLITSLKGL